MSEASNDAELSIREGVLLGHALVARVAEALDVRVFFIKGPASVMQGLRDPRTSADIDVFVEPKSLEHLLEGLKDRGWRERPVNPHDHTFPRHSVTVDHADWPCCIDIHFRFPGMEKPNSDCFDMMWTRTEELTLASHMLRVPTPTLGILILALHALRAPHLASCRQELAFLAVVTKQEALEEPVLEVAGATGALAAMRPFLEPLLPNDVTHGWPNPSAEWQNQVNAKEPGSARLRAIVQAPWQGKPKMLWDALFPSPEVFLSRDIYADLSLRGQLRQHGARWRRFVQAVPQIVRELRRSRV